MTPPVNSNEPQRMLLEQSQQQNEFLMKMYAEMWGNINRHILVVWQSVSVLVATFVSIANLSVSTEDRGFTS